MPSATVVHLAAAAALVVAVVFVPAPSSAAISVLQAGAKPDGRTDSTDAFRKAWAVACRSRRARTILVPRGRYLLKPIVFQGPCNNNNMRLLIHGTLIAYPNYRTSAKTWIDFNRVDGLRIKGGRLDGKGSALWSCKRSKRRSCPLGPPSLTIGWSSNVKISGLTSVYSKFFHIFVYRSRGVRIEGGKLVAPANSPNTDGIHVQMSTDVTVVSTKIMTGDDCISIGPGTTNMWMESISCGPGHGISIGSLAQSYKEPGVRNITVRKAVFVGTQNGLRIKTWGRPSKGFVKDVVFERARMIRVQNPIIIDQTYCPWYSGCPNKNSGIKISNVVFREIRGSSATQVAVHLNCSPSNPCRGIRLHNVMLTYKNRPAASTCRNVAGKATGRIRLKSCL